MNLALFRSGTLVLRNKTGGPVSQGDVVVLDRANRSAFKTTTTAQQRADIVGVVLEPEGILDGSRGMVVFSGFVPRINLSSAASLGDTFGTHTVAGQAARHSVVQAGDFGQVLGSGSAPSAVLWGNIVQSVGGGGGIISINGDGNPDQQIVANEDDLSLVTAAGTTTIKRNVSLNDGYGYVEVPTFMLDRSSTITYTADSVVFHRVRVTLPIRVTSLSFRVNSGASAGRFASIGVYDKDGSNLLIDSGPIEITTNGVKTYTLGTSLLLRPGWYLLAVTTSHGSIAFSAGTYTAEEREWKNAGVVQFGLATNTSTSGQLPSSLGTLQSSASVVRVPFMKAQG